MHDYPRTFKLYVRIPNFTYLPCSGPYHSSARPILFTILPMLLAAYEFRMERIIHLVKSPLLKDFIKSKRQTNGELTLAKMLS